MSVNKIANDLICIKSWQMDNNSYLLIKDKKVVIIDPSFSGQEIKQSIPSDCQVVGILLTHAHFDHCYDAKMLVDTYNCPVYIHKNDKITYEKYHYANLVDMNLAPFDKNIEYFSGRNLKIGNFNFKIMLTPGHTTGSITIFYENYVFVGDTLFFNSYGRTDLINSSEIDMKKSICNLWKVLKDENLILTGHSKYSDFKTIKQVNKMVQMLIEHY